MTTKKQLKARIRQRMARTGERYLTARRHVLGDTPSTPGQPGHGGWLLRGGAHSDSAALANVLAHHGVRAGGAPLTEAMVFGVGGGLGAGYILWEFAAHDARVLVLGFGNQWQYYDRFVLTALERLGVPAQVHRTGGAKGAAAALASVARQGRPSLVWPDRYLLGYWHLPVHLEGHGGHPVVVYGADERGYHLDDRTLAPLTVPAAVMDAARSRVGSYQNTLLTPTPERSELDEATLRRAALDGIASCAAQLGGTSTSFALPAWTKWARLLTDRRNAKAWPVVFADGRGLVGALLSTWEGIEPVGMTGGNLRVLYADFLDEAADLLDEPAARTAATAFRDAARLWHDLAETALPVDVPEFARMRDLTAAVQESIISDGDAGQDEAAAAAAELWRLRAEHDQKAPLPDDELHALFAAMATRLGEIHTTERAAVAALAKLPTHQ